MAGLARRMRPLKRSTSPFATTPAEARSKAVWLIPRLVAQVAYTEKTSDGRLRHPSFLGLREDKDATEVTADIANPVVNTNQAKGTGTGTGTGTGGERVVRQKGPQRQRSKRAAAKGPQPTDSKSGKQDVAIEVEGIRLTSPNRVMFPEQGATKRAIAEYYARQSQHILPTLQNRPLSFVRCPEGRHGECFFQRHHTGSLPPDLHRIDIPEKSGKSAAYIYVDSAQGLIATAQIGVLELHLWGVRTDRLEHPERVVFDLDPDEGMPFARVRAAALEVREVLRAAGLESFALLTGGKGIHVIAPLVRRREWDDVKRFARGLALRLAEAAPDEYVATAAKSRRKDRIFIDWLRNERGGTAVAPYSPRARPGAPVATPVSWSELPRITTAAAYTLDNIERRLARLAADPWEGYAFLNQSITRAQLEAVG